MNLSSFTTNVMTLCVLLWNFRRLSYLPPQQPFTDNISWSNRFGIFILKGKRNAYFGFLNVGFILRAFFFLISPIYTHWYQQLNSSTNFCNFCWWRVPFAMTPLLHTGVPDYTRRKPDLENEWPLKVMNRWVSFRLNVVSLITNNDNSWPIFPNCNRFRWYE